MIDVHPDEKIAAKTDVSRSGTLDHDFVSGSVIWRDAPPEPDAPATMRPLWKTMIFCTRARPRPVPGRFDVTNGRKMRSRVSAGMPGPLSSTMTLIVR